MLFRNNKSADFKDEFNYLSLAKGTTETEVAKKMLEQGSFNCDILEDATHWYIGECDLNKFNQIRTAFSVMNIKTKVVKEAEDHLTSSVLKHGMD